MVQIDDFYACTVRPVTFNHYSQCQNVGHRASSGECPAWTLEDVAKSVQVFRGGTDLLSNLHVCPEGYK